MRGADALPIQGASTDCLVLGQKESWDKLGTRKQAREMFAGTS